MAARLEVYTCHHSSHLHHLFLVTLLTSYALQSNNIVALLAAQLIDQTFEWLYQQWWSKTGHSVSESFDEYGLCSINYRYRYHGEIHSKEEIV